MSSSQEPYFTPEEPYHIEVDDEVELAIQGHVSGEVQREFVTAECVWIHCGELAAIDCLITGELLRVAEHGYRTGDVVRAHRVAVDDKVWRWVATGIVSEKGAQ